MSAACCPRSSQTPLRLKELPSALPGYSLLQEFSPYVVLRGVRGVGNRCGRRQLPQSRACGASQLPREGAFGRMAGMAREGKNLRPKNFSYYMSLSMHGSLAAVADTAKAEGAALPHALNQKYCNHPQYSPWGQLWIARLDKSCRRGCATWGNCCGRGQLPQALHAVTASTAASSLAREPLVVWPGWRVREKTCGRKIFPTT